MSNPDLKKGYEQASARTNDRLLRIPGFFVEGEETNPRTHTRYALVRVYEPGSYTEERATLPLDQFADPGAVKTEVPYHFVQAQDGQVQAVPMTTDAIRAAIVASQQFIASHGPSAHHHREEHLS